MLIICICLAVGVCQQLSTFDLCSINNPMLLVVAYYLLLVFINLSMGALAHMHSCSCLFLCIGSHMIALIRGLEINSGAKGKEMSI